MCTCIHLYFANTCAVCYNIDTESNSCSAKAQLVDERLVAGGWLRFQNSGSGSCCKSLKARFSLGDRHRLP